MNLGMFFLGCVNWQLQSWPQCSFGLGDVFVNASLVIDVLAEFSSPITSEENTQNGPQKKTRKTDRILPLSYKLACKPH